MKKLNWDEFWSGLSVRNPLPASEFQVACRRVDSEAINYAMAYLKRQNRFLRWFRDEDKNEIVLDAVAEGEDPDAVWKALPDVIKSNSFRMTVTSTWPMPEPTPPPPWAAKIEEWRKSGGPYGFCPICGEPGIVREKRPNGNDYCVANHCYPSEQARKPA